MPAKAPKKKPSGSAVMKAAGRKPLMLSMTPEERETIRVAAAMAGMGSAPWVLQVALAAAAGRESD